MSEVVIRAERLGKLYRIGERRAAYRTLRESLSGLASRTARRIAPRPGNRDRRGGRETIWALRDTSFEVTRGEVVGIIGRNGAGKSTLLKLLSRITEPTEGRAEIQGRVGSLLEVGTGFHFELTGRENVYLNGAILGMRKAEIDHKFDEIVAFAEVEQFIDTPVKHYSTGMLVRLAFAVAAHLEPEILLVDEVLAVGDAAFQKKCLGKMENIARQGRTVLFVSHSLASVQAMCEEVLVLEDGTPSFRGSPTEGISFYLSSLENQSAFGLEGRRAGEAGTPACFTAVRCIAEGDPGVGHAVSGKGLDILLSYESVKPNNKLDFAVGIYNMMGEKLVHMGSAFVGAQLPPAGKNGTVICRIGRLPLPRGRYRISVSLWSGSERFDHLPNVVSLDVADGDFFGSGKLPPPNETKVLVDHSWVAMPNDGCRSHPDANEKLP
jgi:lipopolysaccharide transport system ATP-binding protein